MISFYITCFGRLHHLRETLPRNLEAAPGCEFVVVNWGSLQSVVNEVNSLGGRVVNVAGADWDLNTARNIGWRNCTHDIRVSLDADNWISDPSVIDWCRAEFAPENGGDTHYIHGTGTRGHHGRIAATRAAYEITGGWPEGITPPLSDVEDMLDEWRSRRYTSRRWPTGSFGVIDHPVEY